MVEYESASTLNVGINELRRMKGTGTDADQFVELGAPQSRCRFEHILIFLSKWLGSVMVLVYLWTLLW
jgi:hypothetical protein